MSDRQTRLEELRRKREEARQGGGEARIAAQHERGQLTARERICFCAEGDVSAPQATAVSGLMSLGWASAQTRSVQGSHDRARVHRLRSLRYGAISQFVGDVVMVAAEGALR